MIAVEIVEEMTRDYVENGLALRHVNGCILDIEPGLFNIWQERSETWVRAGFSLDKGPRSNHESIKKALMAKATELREQADQWEALCR